MTVHVPNLERTLCAYEAELDIESEIFLFTLQRHQAEIKHRISDTIKTPLYTTTIVAIKLKLYIHVTYCSNHHLLKRRDAVYSLTK
jgi:hypothetical protein